VGREVAMGSDEQLHDGVDVLPGFQVPSTASKGSGGIRLTSRGNRL